MLRFAAAARTAASRQPEVIWLIRFAVVGLAFEIMSAASRIWRNCSATQPPAPSCAARTIPIPAARYGPALWVTISVIACATSAEVLQVTKLTG